MSRGPVPPLVHKVMCGHRLAALRDRTGMSQADVAESTGWSQPKVAHFETGSSTLKAPDLTKALDLFLADSVAREEITKLNDLGRKQPPRNKRVLRNKFEGNMRTVVDMECSAATVWRHNSMVIPGVLQTEGYMHSLFRAYRPSLTPSKIDPDVSDRLERRAVLDNADQQFWFVIHEAALLGLQNLGGGDAVITAQVEYLLEALDRPNIEVQVAPFRHGYYPGQEESYVIFGFDTDPAVQVTYVEKYDGGDILHDTKNLARFRGLWDQHRVHALGPEQTRPFLRELLRSS